MKLVVRGDLQSETGWSRATRALLEAVSAEFSAIIGVDLHYHPDRSTQAFPWPIMKDDEAAQTAAQGDGTVVLHATLPGEIQRYSHAVNLGWWFWETDKLPADLDWIERLRVLDHAFVPSVWQAHWLAQLCLNVPISVLAWPHAMTAAAERKPGIPGVAAHRAWSKEHIEATLDIDRRYHIGRKLLFRTRKKRHLVREKIALSRQNVAKLDFILDRYNGYFFAIQSDAPRKGLPILISEWCRFKKTTPSRAALVIRLSSLHVEWDGPTILQNFAMTAIGASGEHPAALDDVFVIVDELAHEDIDWLYANAKAFVVASYGEGFAGTLVEAVQNNCPVIAPHHTACEQLLPPNYVGTYPTFPHVGSLVNQLPIQPPNSTWHLPVRGAVAGALAQFDRMDTTERHEAVTRLHDHMATVVSPEAARRTFRAALQNLRSATRLSEAAS